MQPIVSATTAPVALPACPRCGQNTRVSQVPGLVAAGLGTTPAKGTTPLQWQGTTYYVPLQAGDSPAARLAIRLFPTARMRKLPIPEVQMPDKGQGSFKILMVGLGILLLVN